MGQSTILMNFKIIMTIVTTFACLLTLILLKERNNLAALFRKADRKKNSLADLTANYYLLKKRGLSGYIFCGYAYGEKLYQNFIKTEYGKNIRLFCKLMIAVLFIRLVILFIVYAGLVINDDQRIGKNDTLITSIEKIWKYAWDTPHYLELARNWYQNEGEARLYIVFFPLYPFLIRLLAYVVPDYFYSGFILSNIFLTIACFYLYKLAFRMYSLQIAAASVKYLLISPFSFFFGTVYTESLFLMLTIMVFYFALQKKWLLTGLLALLASLTRIQGALLFLPLLYEYFRSNPVKDRIGCGAKVNSLYCFRAAGFFLLIPLGLFIYLLINKVVTGDWFKFLEYQQLNWNQATGFFAENLKNYLARFMYQKDGSRFGLWFPHLASFTLVIFLIFYSFKNMRLSFTIYMLVYLIVSYSPTWLLSGSRYTSTLFPIYILLAILARKNIVDKVLTFIFIIFLGFFSLAFFTTSYIM